MHCASLGEYEQGRRVAQLLHELGYEIIVSFFSPSGFDHKVQNPDDFVSQYLYLPIDTPKRQGRFLNKVDPDLVCFVKNEFWFSLIDLLTTRKIPFVFISMYLENKDQYFKWPYIKLFQSLKQANHLFVQDEITKDRLSQMMGVKNISVTGDNRIESILHAIPPKEKIDQFNLNPDACIIYGSVYTDDIEAIKQTIKLLPDYQHIIAPHHLDQSTLSDFANQLSEFKSNENLNIVLVDQMGILKHLYQHASVVYIGGGFQKGLHNTLEALVHFKPIVIGPHTKGFKEIQTLSSTGYINVIQSKSELSNKLKAALSSTTDANALKDFIETNSHNSSRIVDYIHKILN